MNGQAKTCHFFQQGDCRYGNRCWNLHAKENKIEHGSNKPSMKSSGQQPPVIKIENGINKLSMKSSRQQQPPVIRPKKKYYVKHNENFSNHTYEMMNRIEEEIEIRKKHLICDPFKYMQEMIKIGALDKVETQFTYENDIYEKGVDYSSNRDDDKIMCSNKWIKPEACKPWTLEDLPNIVIVELKEESKAYCTQPSRLKHILKQCEVLKDLKENPRFNLEKKLIALKIDDAENISKLIKIKFLINEREAERNRSRAKGQSRSFLSDYWSEDEFFVYHVVFPVHCFQHNKSIAESERWWEDKTKYVLIHIIPSSEKNSYQKKIEIKFQNDQAVEDTELHSIAEWSQHLRTPYQYFCGLCNTCAAEPSKLEDSPCKKLLMCAGCQIVSYCSKDCQKEDWNNHKKTCKDIGVNRSFIGTKFSTGMNVFDSGHYLIYLMKSMNEEDKKMFFLSYLRFRGRPVDYMGANRYGSIAIDQYVNGNYEEPKDKIRHNELKYPKICNMCFEGGKEKLTICDCRCVAYCNEKHKKEDVKHKSDCKNFNKIAREYAFSRNNSLSELPMPQTEAEVENLIEVLGDSKLNLVPAEYMDDPWLDVKQDLLAEHLSVPLTVLYVMKEIMCYTNTQKFIGSNETKEHLSLTLHVLCAQPLLDPGAWELLLHQLKGVKQLNLVFCNNGVSHDYGRGYNPVADVNDCVNHLNTSKMLKRCSQCHEKNRLITYHVFNGSYYSYYNQVDSMKPDIVFASGCRNLSDQAMDSDEDDDDEESYDGIPYSKLLKIKGCPLILAEESEERMMNLVDEFSRNIRCQELMSLRKNPFAGFSRERRIIDKICKDGSPIRNERDWIACIKRKNGDHLYKVREGSI